MYGELNCYFYIMDIPSELTRIIFMLQQAGSPVNVRGMRRFGIQSDKAYGVKHDVLRVIAKPYKRNQLLAEALWRSGCHECRLLAGYMADPGVLSEETAEAWLREVDSWDICDHLGTKVFPLCSFAKEKVKAWSVREGEFEKRMAFSLMVGLTIRGKKMPDQEYLPFFKIIKAAARDPRNFVKKGVSWALRQLGKRSLFLYGEAWSTAEELKAYSEKSAKWIASDVLRELKRPDIIARLSDKPFKKIE